MPGSGLDLDRGPSRFGLTIKVDMDYNSGVGNEPSRRLRRDGSEGKREMGWTFTKRHDGESVQEFFTRQFAGERPGAGVVDCAIVKRATSTAYLAYADGQGTVYAIVCLLETRPGDRCDFGYKDIDEYSGPCERHCTKSILDQLSPLPPVDPDAASDRHEWARRWRAECRANLKTAGGRVRKDAFASIFA